MIVLDTNVVSEAQRLHYDANCAQWLADQQIETLYITTPTIAEMAFGGHKILLRDGSDRYIQTLDAVIARNFPSRVLPFDQSAALIYGQIRAARQASGLPTPVIDLQIAAICLAPPAPGFRRTRGARYPPAA